MFRDEEKIIHKQTEFVELSIKYFQWQEGEKKKQQSRDHEFSVINA